MLLIYNVIFSNEPWSKVFLNPAEFGTPPVSEVSAFYRWLQLVSSHDWNEGPVIVDPDMVNSEKR